MQGMGLQLANAIIKGRVDTEQKRLLERLAAQNSELRAARTRLQEFDAEGKKQGTSAGQRNQECVSVRRQSRAENASGNHDWVRRTPRHECG